MSENLLQMLQNKENTFSKGQKLLAKYIGESYDTAAFMTAAKLGKTVGVSESTVVRFAIDLGFDGYPGLQKAMQLLVHHKMSSDYSPETIPNSDSVSNVFNTELESIRQTDIFLDRDVLSKIVELISGCDNIYVIGANTNALLAEYLGCSLRVLFDKIHIMTESGDREVLSNLFRVSSRDVVLAINFPQYSTATENAVCYCRTAGATVVGFTNSRSSTFTKNCDYVLFAKCEKSYFGNSIAAPAVLMNALVAELAVKHEKTLNDTFAALEQTYKMFNVENK